MSTTPPPPEKPKRQHRTLDEARDLVTAWQSSGKTKEAWCRDRGLQRSALSSYVHRVEQADARAVSPNGFVAVHPPRAPRDSNLGSTSSSPIVIALPSGLRITGLDAAGVATVVRLLSVADS